MTAGLIFILAAVAVLLLADTAFAAFRLRARLNRERKRGRTHA